MGVEIKDPAGVMRGLEETLDQIHKSVSLNNYGGRTKYEGLVTLTQKAVRIREEAEDLREEFDAVQEAFKGYDVFRSDYGELIKAFNKYTEILNRQDGGNREPLTPEGWTEYCAQQREELAEKIPRLGKS